MKWIIIIPAHNESKSIGPLIERLRLKNFECLVIDDGSTDMTADLAAQKGAIVISTGKKSGKGAALRLGIKQILNWEYEAVLFMDGDGQHSPEDVEKFIHVYQESKADIVNGNRFHDPRGMPWIRLITNRLMSCLISSLCHQLIQDTQCGFRLVSVKVLRALKLTSDDFEIETEILIQSAKKGYSFASVDIQTIYRDEVSKIHPFKDTLRFIRYLCKELFRNP